MRDLTAKQKKLLDKFLDEHKDVGSVRELINESLGFYEQLEKIHDTEILHQNINRFIDDKRSDEL